VVGDEPTIGGIDLKLGIEVRNAYVRQAKLLCESLQLAVPVGDADRTNVIPFRKEQLEDREAVLLQPRRVSSDFHPFVHGGQTRRGESIRTFDFDQTKPAGPHISEAVDMAECGNKDVVLAGDIKDGLVGAARAVTPVNL
jgi:hypothetical protein